jgi:glycosyltransferase involved in cell wall biosynthesis
MKIGLVSTYANATPPLSYGGEVFYWNIANELGKRGHEVHLFATGGSLTPENGYLHLSHSSKNGFVAKYLEERLVEDFKDIMLSCDIIHSCSLDHIESEKLKHIYGYNKILNTINGHTYYMPRPPFNVVTGSKWWQEDALRNGLKTEMVYWGVDTDFYTPGGEKEDYYLWIARFHPDKGLDWALDLAEILGFKLKVAGSLNFSDHRAFGNRYLKRIESIPNVEYVKLPLDSTHHVAKRELYRKAKAFLYPVQYQECFGMVVIEAMACGTPVIACPNGAMPELIEDGVSGFLCKDKREFGEVILKKIPFCWDNRKEHNGFNLWNSAREKALQFDYKKSVDAYIKLYERIIKGETW